MKWRPALEVWVLIVAILATTVATCFVAHSIIPLLAFAMGVCACGVACMDWMQRVLRDIKDELR